MTWTNVDPSLVRTLGIHLRAVLQEIIQISVSDMCFKIMQLKFLKHLPGGNELRHPCRCPCDTLSCDTELWNKLFCFFQCDPLPICTIKCDVSNFCQYWSPNSPLMAHYGTLSPWCHTIGTIKTIPSDPGSAFIQPDQLDPWIKDQIGKTLLSTILHLQLPNFVSCGRDKPSHMTQNLVTVGAKF